MSEVTPQPQPLGSFFEQFLINLQKQGFALSVALIMTLYFYNELNKSRTAWQNEVKELRIELRDCQSAQLKQVLELLESMERGQSTISPNIKKK
jgi:hypothetical protein